MTAKTSPLLDWLPQRILTGRTLVLFGAAIWLAINMAALDWYPLADCDEAILSEIGYNAWRGGRFGFDSHLGIGNTDVDVSVFGRLYEAILGSGPVLFGASLWSSRISSLAAAVIGTIALYQVGRAMYVPRVGLVAAMVFATSWRTIFHAHFARPEIWVAAGSVILLWLLWRMLENFTPLNGFLAGLGASLIVDVHLAGLPFAFASGGVVVMYAWHRRNWQILIAFATGGVAGLIYWLAVHVLPDPVNFRYQIFTLYVNVGDVNLSQRTLLGSIEGLGRFYWQQFVTYNNYLGVLPAIYMLVGIGYVAFSPKPPARLLTGYYALATVIFTLIGSFDSYYTMTWIPLLALMSAIAIDALAVRLTPLIRWAWSTEGLVLAGLLTPLVFAFVAGDLYLFTKFRNSNFDEYIHPLSEMIPPGEALVAAHQFWYARPEDPFIASTATVWWEVMNSNTTTFDREMAISFFKQVTPAYVLMHPNWLCIREPDFNRYDVVYPLVAERCDYVGQIEGDWYPKAELFYCETITP